jgi:hypothetical protein
MCVTLRKDDDVPRSKSDGLLIYQATPARPLRYDMKLYDMLRGGHDEGPAYSGRRRFGHPWFAYI